MISRNIGDGVSVRSSDTSDALFLTPQDGHYLPLLQLLRECCNPRGSGFTRTAEGIRVSPEIAEGLYELESRIKIKWTPDARRFVENRRHINAVHNKVFESLLQIKREGVSLAKQLISDCRDGLEVLDQHQIVNVAAMTLPGSPGLCVFDEQGVGKTVTFVFAFDLLVERDQADFAIIFAPKSMIGEWPEDLRRFRFDIYRTVVVTGSVQEKRRLLSQGADIFVTNFETAVTMESELRALMSTRPDRIVLAIDESYFVKSLDAKRTRALRRLREWAGRTYVLCGTPAPNSPSDLVQQFNLVDFGFCFRGVKLPPERELASKVVQSAIEKRGLFVRHLKSQVMPELPRKRFQRVIIPMAPEQGRMYRANLEQLITDVENLDDYNFNRNLKRFLARRTALLQVCSNPAGVFESYREVPAKLSALDSIVEHVVNRKHEKVVIWSFYTASLKAISERYRSYGLVRYDGSVTDVKARREAVRLFQEDDETMVFVGNPAAAGAGLTLHRARIAIYESLSNQAAHYLQSLDRIHRRGQERDVEYMIMLCEDSLELNEFDRLVHKEQSAHKLLQDSVEAHMTRDTFLSDVRKAAELLNNKNARDESGLQNGN